MKRFAFRGGRDKQRGRESFLITQPESPPNTFLRTGRLLAPSTSPLTLDVHAI
jgi:hypothetical protein